MRARYVLRSSSVLWLVLSFVASYLGKLDQVRGVRRLWWLVQRVAK